MKILLISPAAEDDLDNYLVREVPFLGADAFFAPHALTALAAITPADHDLTIHDEHVDGPADEIIRAGAFDIIGVSLFSNQLERTLALARFCRSIEHRAAVVVGGVGTLNMLGFLTGEVDACFIGEAEDTWPEYLTDYAAGQPKPVYQRLAKPDMSKIPPPRWDLIGHNMHRYALASVQVSRGCPHNCSFCDVIYTYGRKMRHKRVEQVLDEIRALERMDLQMVYIADDNFAGNRAYAKTLLREMIAMNNAFRRPLCFLTQTDLTIADDTELLELLADANFAEVQIGIESVDPESLRHMNKAHRVDIDAREAVLTIQSYGMAVLAHMIIGTDNDSLATFERNLAFIREANICQHLCHPLTAPPGTRLWYDMKRQGRLVETSGNMYDQLDTITNIVPATMTRPEFMRAMANYWEQSSDPADYYERAVGFMNGIRRKPNVKRPGPAMMWKMRKMMAGMFRYFCFQAEPEIRRTFFRLTRQAARHGGDLVPKIIQLYTRYLVDYKRNVLSARRAREQADYEEAHPEQVTLAGRETPIPEGIKRDFPSILEAAKHHLEPHLAETDDIGAILVQSLVAFTDLFGRTLETFDDLHRDRLCKACDGALADVRQAGETEHDTDQSDARADTSTTSILNALDRALRVRSSAPAAR